MANTGIKEIHPDTLQEWLAGEKPITVIDIRPKHDYDDWHIAEAVNVDSYNALQFRRPGELENFQPEHDGPVVAVCYAGNTSKLATYYLQSKGIDAYSLMGGMQWWSLAWNKAEIQLETSPAKVVQIRRTGKGCLSYIIGVDGEAVVIDASVDPEVYAQIAEEEGLTIKMVLETHVHADHLTRGRVLAEQIGARYLLPDTDRTSFEHDSITHGAELELGSSKIKAFHMPGHTNESMAYILDDEVVFTADTLFPTSIGRPDLAADKDELIKRTSALYESLHALKDMNENLLIAACHTSNPVAFKSEAITSTIKEAINNNPLIQEDKNDFVEKVTGRIPETPPNHLQIIQFNERGIFPQGDVTALEAGSNRCAI